MSEDIHDLFDGGDTDEPDDSAGDPDERSRGSDGPANEADPPSVEGSDGPLAPAREGTAESTTRPSEGAVGGDGSRPAASTGDVHDLFDNDGSEESVGGGTDPDDRPDEPAGPAESAIFPTEEDPVESEDPTTEQPAESTSSAGGVAGDDANATETAGSPTPSGTESADAGDRSESGATTPIDAGDAGPTSESEAAAPGTTLPRAKTEDSGSATAASSPEAVAAEGREEPAPNGETAAADGTAPEDRSRSESSGRASPVDGPSGDERDGSRTADADEPASGASEADPAERAATPPSEPNRLSTGIDVLDRSMGGGVPPGRLVALVADPGVQSELIVDAILAQRDTLFVTTDRPDWEVMKDIEPGLGSGEVMIREHTPDSLLLGLDSLLDELGTSSNFVLDSVNELELVPRQRYRSFLSDVKRRLFDTGSMGLLTGVTVGHESARDLTLRRADIVWRLETRTTEREIDNRLSVPKFRGGAAMTETVKVELTDEVRVDPGWDDG